MIDPKILRQSASEVARMLERRGFEFDADGYNKLESKRKSLQIKNEELKNQRNISSKNIGIAKSKNEDILSLMQIVEEVNKDIKVNEKQLNETLAKINSIELWGFGHGCSNLSGCLEPYFVTLARFFCLCLQPDSDCLYNGPCFWNS